jgi:hypothetical protein
MAERKRVVFVTYYVIWPVGMIGVFKRCLRIIERMHQDYDVHMLHFGALPAEDPVFQRVRGRITVENSIAGENLRERMTAYYSEIQPHAVIFGECPCAGSMLMAYRTAPRRTARLIGIDNYSGHWLSMLTATGFHRVQKWLFLGLLPDGELGLSRWRYAVAPPLVSTPPGLGAARDRVCVLGYDRATLVAAYDILSKLPPGENVELFLSDDVDALTAGLPYDKLPHKLTRTFNASDAALFDSFARAKVVLGKAGFQQIVESIALGAPIVCQMYETGVRNILVPGYLRPYVRLVWTPEDRAKAMPKIAEWVRSPAPLPWARSTGETPDLGACAARRLESLINAN